MEQIPTKLNSISQRGLGVKMLQAATVALLLVLALPGRAEERAVKSRVPPVYPEIAKRMRITGVVKIQATVDADGKVTDAKAVSGNHVLGAAAEEAVRKWKFESGAGVSTVELDINFAMAN
jgi:TonB family protein